MMWFLFILISMVAGALNGLRERQRIDLKVFERAFKVKAESWLGSQSWLLKYKNWPDDQRARFPGSLTWMAWATDFWHFSGAASKAMFVALAMMAGGFGWLHAGIFLVAYGVGSHLAYEITGALAHGYNKF